MPMFILTLFICNIEIDIYEGLSIGPSVDPSARNDICLNMNNLDF